MIEKRIGAAELNGIVNAGGKMLKSKELELKTGKLDDGLVLVSEEVMAKFTTSSHKASGRL